MPRRKILIALVAAAIGIFVTISLGNWQTRRGDMKLALQAQADEAERAAAVTVEPSRASIESIAVQLPRKVRLTGVFDPAGSVYLDNRTLDGVAGFYVITPLVIGEGPPMVLIDRGWMARDMTNRSVVAVPPPSTGRVSIEGLAVARPSMLLELGDARERRVPGFWHNLDYSAYEQVTGRPVGRFVVRQSSDASDGLRREWPRPATGVEKHRGYAIQWYSLAALIALLTAWFGWKAWRKR
ncbi:MAG: SURF1 family protein [Burkholderiaceae bacterium]